MTRGLAGATTSPRSRSPRALASARGVALLAVAALEATGGPAELERA